MVLFTKLVVFSSLSALTLGSFYEHSANVKELDRQNFDDFVQKSIYPVIVEFYAPWCGYCKQFTPEYLKAASRAKSFAKFGAVNCDEGTNKKLCLRYKVGGFPTVKGFFKKRNSNGDKRAIDFKGNRNAIGLIEYAEKNLESKAHIIKDFEKMKEFIEQDTPKAILFTDKSKIPNMWKGLSLRFNERLNLGVVGKKHSEIIEKYDIKSFPSIAVFTGGSEPKTVNYDGSFEYEEIVSFLKEHALPSKQKDEKETTRDEL
ncbi:hypothetical protein BB559_002652 [Furculomyces boomerangus]|uniref:Thioredoxin domain-containing protein n=1 Tax=Furculomyces boomerangus TaxID=61424 RepID=A0A2T9YTR3_9FUNG|nr:hypothetical protein BB559_004972 [Furculomyces boomerangus]PVU95686.1 hypothetical protein BB559_002652 [Furculomyces boomerangus]